MYGCRLWSSLKTIDISGTNITLNPDMCLGNSTVVVRGMVSATAAEIQAMVDSCLTRVQLLDISENTILNNLSFVSSAMANFFVVLPIRYKQTAFGSAPS